MTRWLVSVALLLMLCPLLVGLGLTAIIGPVGGATSCNMDVTAQGSAADNIPDVTTLAATGVSGITATVNGRIDDSHNGIIEEWGFQWGTASGNYTDNSTTIGVGAVAPPTWVFDLTKNDWTPDVTIFFRAIARNSEGWGYGGELSFVTALILPGPPINFDAVAISMHEVEITWTLGFVATHTLVKRQVGSYPATIADGVEVYWGTGTFVVDGIDLTFLDEDVYYRAWSWNAVGWSATYAQDIVEVRPAMANALMLMGMIFLGLGLTFGGYWSKRWPIVIAASAVWLAFAMWAFTNSAETWDIYRWFGIVGAIMLLISVIEPIVMRDKPQTEVEKDDEELVIEDALKTWRESGALQRKLDEGYGRPRKRRKAPVGDEDIL